MLLLNCRTPISGSDHALKIFMLNHSTERLIEARLNLKFKKKINKMPLQGSETPSQGCDHTLKISMSIHGA